jgi:hypothetical protein
MPREESLRASDTMKVPSPLVTPAKAGVQESHGADGFPLSRE